MPQTIYQLRSPRFRLLASLLVMLAILCNGISLAQAHSMNAKSDCCPEMTAHQMASDKMSGNANSCPKSNFDCDDLCMARCMSANGILSVALSIAPNVLMAATLPRLKAVEHSLVEFSPGLRPPIYS